MRFHPSVSSVALPVALFVFGAVAASGCGEAGSVEKDAARRLVAAGNASAAPPVAPPLAPVAPPEPAPRPEPDAAQVVAQRVDMDRWDRDVDGLVDPAEFGRGVFEMTDRDGDGRVSAAEFEAARAWLPGEPDPGTIARWDDDGDGLLEPRAFTSGIIVDGLDHAWDQDGDGRLRRAEIADGIEAAFDRDGDGELQRSEQAGFTRIDG